MKTITEQIESVEREIAMRAKVYPRWVEQGRYTQQKADHEIYIFSGRSDAVRGKTEEWLREHRVPHHVLLMRREGDYTPDDQLKLMWLSELDKSEILFTVDDRQKVVDMWRAEGLTCLQVAPGDF